MIATAHSMTLYDSQRSGVSIQSPRSPSPHVQDAKAPHAHRMPAGEVRQAALSPIHKRCDDPSENVAAPSAIRRSDSKLIRLGIAPSQARTCQDFRKPTISAIATARLTSTPNVPPIHAS